MKPLQEALDDELRAQIESLDLINDFGFQVFFDRHVVILKELGPGRRVVGRSWRLKDLPATFTNINGQTPPVDIGPFRFANVSGLETRWQILRSLSPLINGTPSAQLPQYDSSTKL